MQQSFLYRLYSYSRTAFTCCMVFVLCYAVFLFKNMDMMLFPHNSMFAGAHARKDIYSYALKINGSIVPVTQKLWWKKDFLESNAGSYGKYYLSGGQTMLGNYIDNKVKRPSLHTWLRQHLTAGNITPEQWALFYTRFAGHALSSGDAVQLLQYELEFTATTAVIADSVSIFNFRQP